MDRNIFNLVVFLPTGGWEFNTRQRMIMALAQGMLRAYPESKILCVERPICPVSSPMLHFKRFFRWISGKRRLRQITENLFVMTPWVLIHDLLILEIPLLVKANNIIQRRQLRKALRSIGAKGQKLIVWIYHPYQRHYFDMLNQDLMIYEVYDEYHEFVNVRQNKRRVCQIRQNEQIVLQKANVIFTTATKLFQRLTAEHSYVFLVPNGVDFEHFYFVPAKAAPPEEFDALRRPYIGFVGKINEQIDYLLIDYLAAAHPEWSLILIGLFDGQHSLKHRPDFLSVHSKSNVHFWGYKDYAVLPEYVHAFDICMIPFVVNRLTESIYPLKLHEYLAAGKSVVSTALPEVICFQDIVRIAHTPAAFERHVAEALEKTDEDSLLRRRQEVARENSWTERARNVLSVLEDVLVDQR